MRPGIIASKRISNDQHGFARTQAPMVNLTIRLSKGTGGDGSSSHGGPGDGSTTSGSEPAVTVSCPDHLVLADLPVAKGLGSVSDVTVVKILGRKARRRLGDKVHFCVRCNFPIAIYGRLDPCEHIFCLTCARRDSSCYLCGDRILRIQRMEVLDGIFICGAPRCLRSFLKKQDFQSHVKEAHGELLEPAEDKEEMQIEANPLKTVSAEPQVHTPNMAHSPSSSLQLPPQEQRVGPVQPQRSDNQPSRAQTKSAVSPSTVEEKQIRQNQTKASSSGTKQSDHELHQKQQQNQGGDRTHKHQEKQQQEEVHSEDQAQPDLQQAPQPPQPPRPPGPMPASPLGIPSFSPQPFPPPYHVLQEGQGIQPLYSPYQIPHGGHLPPPPPLPPPRPPPSLPPPPPLMPPPPPKRGKFESGMPPVGEPQMDQQQSYVWSDGRPNFGAIWNFGGWSGS